MIENDAVNRLERQAFVVNVHDFHKGEADAACFFFRIGKRLFVFVPYGLCRGKGVVPVTNGEQECVPVLVGSVFRELLKSRLYRLFGFLSADSPTRNRA